MSMIAKEPRVARRIGYGALRKFAAEAVIKESSVAHLSGDVRRSLR
jgi:hypothetical protein